MNANDAKTLDFEIESEPKYLEEMRTKIREFIRTKDFSEKTQESILVALGEACTNAIRHSYHNETGHKIGVLVLEEADKVTFKIRDYGEKIDLAKVKKPVIPPEKPGGLGLYFMETIMDEMKYNVDHPQGNELILTKYKEKGEKSS